MSKKLSEFEVIREVTDKLGLENKTDGTIVRYPKAKFTKPDAIYEYKDVILILDAKGEGKKFIGQLESYLPAEKKLHPKKQIFGIKYNKVTYQCYLNSIDNLLVDEKVIADKEYYFNLAHNKELDQTEIYNKTRAINNILHTLGLTSLLDRMVWTVCVLVACRSKKITNTELSYKQDVIKYLKEEIKDDLKVNDKLNVLIAEFSKIDIRNNPEKLEEALNIINDLSDLLNSSKWRGEDVGGIFFNEFTRYKGKAQDGQVFTPEIWTGFMYKLINVNSNNKVLDAACGSGGFLVKAMHYMISECPEERVRIHKQHLFGVENSDKIFAVACANMLLHKDGKSNLMIGDSTTKEIGDWIKSHDIDRVLMNPPFENQTGIKIVLNVLNNVRKNSLCAFILPDRTLYTKSQNTVKQIFDSHQLTHIIKMPKDTWNGLSAGMETSIFLFKSHNKHRENKIIKYWIQEDGLETVKNSGRHDIYKKWQNELEPYWLDIILNNKSHSTKQTSEIYEYEIKKKIKPLCESDFDKVLLDRLLFENPKIKEKVEEIKEKDWLLWSLKSPRKKGDE